MRTAALALLVLLALFAAPAAQAEEPQASVELARKAYAAQDAGALAGVANAGVPDVWIVVESLLAGGEYAVAEALVAQRRDLERQALTAYVAWRREHPVPPEVLAALREAPGDPDPAAALASVEPLLAGGRGVSYVLLAELRTALVERLRRGVGAVGEAMLASAASAEAIGWHRRAVLSYRAAFERLFNAHAAEGMETATRALLRLAGRSGAKADGFMAHQVEAFRLQQLGRTADALTHAQASLELAESVLQRRNALRVVIMAHIRLGNDHVVVRNLAQLNQLDRALGDEHGAALSDTQLARYEALLGHSTRAMARIERVLAWMKKHGGDADLYGTHLQAAQIRTSLGDPERAIEHIQLARAAEARVRAAGETGYFEPFQLDKMEALALAQAERYAEAEALNRKVVEGRTQASPAIRIYDLVALAINLAYLGRHEEAAALFARAEALLGPGLESHIHARFHAVRASALVLAGRLDDALAEAETAERISRDDRFYEFRRSSLGVVGRVWFERGDMRRAAEAFDGLLRLLLDRSARLPDLAGARLRSSLATRQKHLSIYYGIEAAARTGDPALLFQLAERLGAVALRNRLGAADVADSLAPALREKELALQEAETQAVRDLRRADGAEARAAALAALGAVRRDLDRHRERMRAEQAAAAQVIDPAIDDLASTRARLAPDEALVLYAEGVRHLWAVVADRKAARIVRVGARADVETLLDTLVLEDASAPWQSAVAGLRAALVEPLGLAPAASRLVVVPAGPLAFLPYAAAFAGRDVTLLPSVTAGRLLAAQPTGGRGVLAVGDPESADGRRLPGSRAEAQAVGDVVRVGKDATEAGIRAALATRPRWRAVHIACHGLIDPFHPLRSALALTPAGDDDGLWTVSELLRTRIPTDLAVLGACSTGRGRSFSQEGVLGFAHAFFVAGARQVIVSLWDVDDAAASALLQRFHEEWKPGVPAAAALSRAQAWVRDQPRWAHPAYWAAWQLWGPP